MHRSKFSQILLNWFDQHGRKNLPWQKNINPYRVWVSEIMLQQTQVATVIPYYEKFIKKFPTVSKLAAASTDEVLQLWTGLGYYARGRNLHKAAKIIVTQFKGKFPDTLEALQTLPGIGRSTAGAILAISMNQTTPILDGNVKRVLTRFHAIEGWPGNKEIEKKLWEIATKQTPKTRTADYTQAIMDLGATVCVRSKPLCKQCPFIKSCQAFSQNRMSEFPYRNLKQKILPVKNTYLLLLQNAAGALLLEKRPPVGIWGGLWSFPETKENVIDWCLQQNFLIEKMQEWPSFRHTFSHFHLDITPVLIETLPQTYRVMDSDAQVWYKPAEALKLGIAAPVKKLLEKLTNLV